MERRHLIKNSDILEQLTELDTMKANDRERRVAAALRKTNAGIKEEIVSDQEFMVHPFVQKVLATLNATPTVA